MRQVVGYSLWLGHVGDVQHLPNVLSAGILAIVDLALDELPLPRELVHCRFPLIDGSGNPRWLLQAAVATVVCLVRSETPTLLYCGAGMSRAPAVAGAAIAVVRGCSPEEGLSVATRSGAADVSPALWSELRAAIA